MAPRITLHTSVGSSTSSRALSTLDQHHQAFHTNGSAPHIAVDESEDLSDMDEASAEEVDELDESDSGEKDAQPQWETISSASPTGPASVKSVAKKPRPKPPTTRVPGQTIVPMSRIEAILSSDAGQNVLHSREAAYLVSLATEEFIRRLTRVAHSRSRLDKRSLTTYNDIADSAFYFEEYAFLQEMIPRPLSPKSALAERKRILEEQEALLHGVGVEGAGSAHTGKCELVQPSASASTSNTSTPVPKLSRPTVTGANGKTASKARKRATDTGPPVVRSERQKLKRARIASESQATGEQSASGRVPPPPSPATAAEGVNKPEDINGSSSALKSSGMKIKIPSRAVSTSSSAAQVSSKPQPPILPLGPPKRPSSPQPGDWADRPTSRCIRQPSRKQECLIHELANEDHPLVFKEDMNDGLKKSPDTNGGTGNMKFAPVGVEVTDHPLWTRVPLPPPPSAKVTKTPALNEDSINRPQMTDLDRAAEQARSSRALKGRSVHEHGAPSNPKIDEREKPITKRARQRTHPKESTASRASLRDSANGTFPNTGRTIYSQR